jgi:hypothetical protein
VLFVILLWTIFISLFRDTTVPVVLCSYSFKFVIHLCSLLGYFLGLWAERKRLEEERVKEEQEYEEEKRRREEEKEKRKEAKAKVGDVLTRNCQLHVSKGNSMARKWSSTLEPHILDFITAL